MKTMKTMQVNISLRFLANSSRRLSVEEFQVFLSSTVELVNLENESVRKQRGILLHLVILSNSECRRGGPENAFFGNALIHFANPVCLHCYRALQTPSASGGPQVTTAPRRGAALPPAAAGAPSAPPRACGSAAGGRRPPARSPLDRFTVVAIWYCHMMIPIPIPYVIVRSHDSDDNNMVQVFLSSDVVYRLLTF